MNNTERLEKIIASTRLSESRKTFVQSLLDQSKKRELSPKQVEFVDKFWEECFPPQDIIDAEMSWINSFTDEMRENISIIGEYYSHHYPNSRVATNHKDPTWIPDKAVYDKAVGSQYARATIANYKKPFRFNVGDTVAMRDTAHNRSRYPKNWIGGTILILEQIKEAKQNFVCEYKVICVEQMEDQNTYNVKEDHLNIIKKKKVQNG